MDHIPNEDGRNSESTSEVGSSCVESSNPAPGFEHSQDVEELSGPQTSKSDSVLISEKSPEEESPDGINSYRGLPAYGLLRHAAEVIPIARQSFEERSNKATNS